MRRLLLLLLLTHTGKKLQKRKTATIYKKIDFITKIHYSKYRLWTTYESRFEMDLGLLCNKYTF